MNEVSISVVLEGAVTRCATFCFHNVLIILELLNFMHRSIKTGSECGAETNGRAALEFWTWDP